MAAAYAYADGGPISNELLLLQYSDRFGAQAVIGSPVGAGELKRMIAAENVVSAYQERARAKEKPGWAIWAKENPNKARLLEIALVSEING